MSLLPTTEIGYIDYVSEYFLAQKGTGLMLSPLDVELVRRYEGQGIPFEVLCRGVARAFEVRHRHGKDRSPQLSLRACKRSIEAEVRRHARGALRGPGPLPEPAHLDRLLGRLRSAPNDAARAGYRAAYRAACGGEALAPAAAFAYLAALPRTAQRGLCGAVFRSLAPRMDEPMVAEAHWLRERLRDALARAALEHGKLALD